jgi:molybdenum cofactor biosynthesis enzyme MoaA
MANTPLAETGPAMYGFGGALSAAFPSQVIIDVTELCNLACTHCPHPVFKKSAHYAGRTLDAALSRKAIGEIATAGRGIVQQVRYASDGEPLLCPGIFRMLEDAVVRAGTCVSLTTNGTLLTAARIERLLATGIQFVDISVDALTPETYARIRVRGDLSVTRANIERLIGRARGSGSSLRIVVSYIEQPENAHETAAFEQFWRDAGADAVVVRRLHSASGSIVSVAELMRRRAATTQRRACVYPWERIVLTPRGTLAFCPADWTRGSNMVDYRTTTIAQLWQSERYAALRRAHLTNDYSHHAFCGQCPDWQETRWPHEGPSYATLVERMRDIA